MMHYFQKAIFGLFFLLCFYNANSNVLLVENLANSGPKSLRDEINAALFNDTILINIKGTIILISPLLIDKSLVIIGATASHTSIDVNGQYIDVNGPNLNVFINDLRIINGAGGTNPTTLIQGSANVYYKNVLFENINSAGNGGALRMMASGTLSVENCSFFNNSTSLNGGAIFISTVGYASVRNCTFFNNSANNGGAIQNDGNALLVNNTFLNNTSTSGIAQGHAVNDGNNSAGSLTRIQNNIFTDISTLKHPKVISGSILNMWQTDGGNIFPDNNLIFDFIPSGGPNDRFNEPFSNLFLRTNAITDGYGLKYFTITSQTSTVIDNGTGGINITNNDCRRAPRILFGDTGLDPDAGSVEFTPYTVTSNNSTGFITTWNALNSASFLGPKYMDFDVTGGGPVNYNLTSSLSNSLSPGVDWIVDGFTQNGSMVAGPKNNSSIYSPAIYMVNISNNSGSIINLNNPAGNSVIAGLNIDNRGGFNGIQVNDGAIHIYGNHIISTTSSGAAGINLTGSNNATIGGYFHHNRNVIGNQVNVGLIAQNDQTNILGNFIGTNALGTATLTNDKGIILQCNMGFLLGKYGFPSMNLISGNSTSQIEIAPLTYFRIKGNIIGPDVTSNTLLTTTARGIIAGNNTDGIIGGLNPGDMNAIGGNTEGILLNSANAVSIFQNYIGISPNVSASFPPIPNVTGISIINNGDFSHAIGNGSVIGRNYICNNSSMGIYAENAINHSIMGNFIGVGPENNQIGNGTRGIHIVGLVSEANDILGNIIGGHSIAGIDVNGTKGAGNISGNKIGTDSTGLLFCPNDRGIQIASTPNNSQIIGNLISGNNNEGIYLDNSSATIQDNIIGINLDTTLALTNGGSGISLLNTNNCDIFGNFIGSNGIHGILLMASNSNWIHGNHIGTNRLGLDFGNLNHGISIFFVSANNSIGGTGINDHNIIKFNDGAGISIEREVSVTGIRGNHFFGNGGHGISLYPAVGIGVVLPNDLNDSDVSGPAGPNVGNNGQNFPDLTSAVLSTGTCNLSGTVNVDNTTDNYLIQVYKVNPGNIDATGHGEGDSLIAEQTFNAGGLNTFNFNISFSGVNLGDVLTTTCTKLVSTNYETSEFSDTIMIRAPFIASIIDSTDVLCNGAANGRLEVSVTGGTNPPYDYQWILIGTGPVGGNSSVLFTGPGTYVCQVTDAVSTTVFSDTATIIEPPLLTVTAVPTNTLCNGSCDGSIVLTETGGTGPFQYSINNGGSFQGSNFFPGLCSGIYQYVVQDNNGCLTPAAGNTVTIGSPSALFITPTFTNETCVGLNDGTITVTPFGGTGGYNYQIDALGYGPGTFFGGLAPGNHIVDVMDANGCTSNILVNILAGENVIADFLVSTTTACQNAADFDLTDISSAPSGISSWNYTLPSGSPSSGTVPNITGVILFNAGANSITLQVISGIGCTDDTTMIVNTNPAVFVDAGPDVTICLGDPFVQSANVVGGSGGNLYNWSVAGHFVNNTIEDADVTVALENTIGYFEHILQVNDVNGCTDRDTMYLDIRSIPTVNAGPDNTVCQGSAYTLAGSGSAISYTWDNGVVDGSPFTPAATTTYTVTGTDAVGCSNTDQVTIGVDLPVTVNAGPDLDECRSTAFSTILNGIVTNATSVLWSTSGSGSWNNTTITNATYFYSGADASGANVTLTLIGNSGNSCPSVSDDLVVTFHNAPSAFAGADFSSCSGTPISLSGGATDYSSVDWTNGTGTFSPDNLSLTTSYVPSAAEISAGFVNLTFTAYATNAACADAADNITITLLTTPVANAGFDGSICTSQFYTLDGAASTGTITAYSWDEVGGANVGTTQLTNVSPAISTNYALTVTNGTCSDSDTMSLSVVTAPDPTFNYSNTSFCNDALNETPTFIATAGGTFSLPTSPASINATTGEINFSGMSIGAHTVIYTITTPCNSADTITIAILPLPIVNAGNDTSFCAGGTVQLNGTGGGSVFNWSNVAGFNSNVNPTSDSPANSDTYTLTVTDANGCTNTDNKIVTVNAIPTGTISGGGAFCEGDPNASLIVTANGYSGGGDWNNQFFQNASPGAIATPPTGTYTLSGLGNSANNGVWTAVITDNVTGCTGNATGSVSINVNPEPGMSIVSPVNACSGMSAFDMDVTFVPNISGGVWSGIGVTGANFNPFSVGVGTYDVVYTMPSGCDDTIQIIVNPAPTVSFTGVNNAYCVTDPPFTPVGTPSGGLWAIDGGTFSAITTVDPSTFSQGTHTISYQYTDGTTGCIGTTPPQGFIISNVPLDPIAVSSTAQSICAGTNLVLTVSNPNTTGTTIQWYSDAALTVNVGSTINFTTPTLTSSVIYYAVAQNAGCKSNPVIFDITVNSPMVSAGPDITICPGTPAQLNVTAVSGTISWSPGISLDDSTIQNPLATPNVNTTYYVTVTSGPCSASDSINVIIDGSNPDCGVVPSYNAFSPDGDGVNDTWIIDAIFNHPDNTVTIFNRWGDKLVSFEDYDNVTIVWDGLYKGEILPSGTYFYVIEYLDINIQVSGWLQLTR